MKPALRQAFNAEMAIAVSLYRDGRLSQSFRHLEVAHVLGQRHVVPHFRTHWWMLRIGLARSAWREIAGQAMRIVLGVLGSAVGIVPTGNTGGTNVSMFKRMPIDPELERLLE